jgi:membrane-bound lytic murein transglycosylase A
VKRRKASLVAALLLAGCAAPTAPPSSPLRLTRATFADLPGWRQAGLDDALASFRRGCAALAKKPSDTAMGGAGFGGTLADWRAVCDADAGDARGFFESRFTPYAVGPDEGGLFTGYYEPELLASPMRGGEYQTPIYGLPSDLIQVNLGTFDPKLAGQRIAGRVDGHSLVPYATRAQIDARPPPSQVLLWVADPVALFFLQIQGSGRARLPDGRVVRLAYAGANGQPYTAIGRTLIAQGALTRENVSLQSIRAWLAAHPDQAQAVMETDLSYVFFAQNELGDTNLGGTGTLGVALTPKASLAVDPRLNVLGAPYFVATEANANNPDPVQALLVAQDTGGAIRGAVRGDIFFGFGAEAEDRAGHMNTPGKLFVLLPNELAARIGAAHTYPP